MLLTVAMKTRDSLRLPHRHHLLFTLGIRPATLALVLVLICGLPRAAFGSSSFVEALAGEEVVDTAVDSFGVTYVLGRNASNQAVLIKYDSSGVEMPWSGDGATNRVVADVNPVALCVQSASSPNSTNELFVVGAANLVRLNADTGLTEKELAFPSGVAMNLNAIYCTDANVFVCGSFSGTSSATIFGKTAHPRGNTAAILIKLNSDLSNTALALTTYGCDGGGNTADSVAVDEAGEVYAAGHFANGVLNLDGSVSPNGQWEVEVVYSSSSVGDLTTALNLLNGASATRTNIAYFDKINFGSGNDGWYGGDAPFPGGGGNYFVLHATGAIWISSAGNYDFMSTTDDGTQVKVDGNTVLTYSGLRSVAPSTGTIYLARGLHVVDYVMFQNEGGASAEFTYRAHGTPYWYWLQPTNLRDPQNKAYVVKFSGDFSNLESAYFTTSETTGSGGEFNALFYSQGWVYAAGFWQGIADNPAIGLPDSSVNGSQDIDIVKLDTDLRLKGRATVKGNANNQAYSVTADNDGNVYVTGSFGPGSVDFVGHSDRSTVDPSQDRPFTSLSSPKSGLFVAKLNSDMDYQWVDQPAGGTTDSFRPSAKVRWNRALQRLFWSGYFVNGTVTLGNPTTQVTIAGPKSFVAVLDPDGAYTERVFLTIVSDYGQSGTQVLPFGGPLVGGNPTSANQQYVIKGAQITASVPPFIFRNAQGDVTSDDQADTRIQCTGYTVDNSVPTGGTSSSSYTFVITKDTTVAFQWSIDYALRIESDLSGTVGTGDPVHGIAGIAGLTSLASGNPAPTVQKHWIAQDDTVVAAIDASVLDMTHPGLPVKYVVTGYDAAGPANTLNQNETNFFAFSGDELRRQVPQFVMNTNALIRYHWKLKIGVQVDTTGPASSGLPLVLVVKDPGQTNSLLPSQPSGLGTGTYYFDEHTRLEIGTVLHLGTDQVQGWYNGDGSIFATSGALSNLNSSFTISSNVVHLADGSTLTLTNVPEGFPGATGTVVYASERVANLVQPARVMWNYGDRIFEETVYIGNSVTFDTVDDPAVRSILRTDLAPDRVDLISGPPNSTPNDMAVWDDVGKKFYPVRPGTILSYWKTTGDPAARVIIRLILKYPSEPHYRHIAQTPPVVLDPATNDLVTFKALEYTEPTTGAAVDSQGRFTATGPGRSVLLFGEVNNTGRGGTNETLRVRVVETKRWDDQLPATQTAIIGQQITSAYDTAGLGSGYVFFQNARYDPFVYDRTNIVGPIIPVNLDPAGGQDHQLVVVWYERRDKILWPYQAVRYAPAWPTPATGLERIVIASRYGSESVAPNGTDQIVTPAETVGTNYVPATTTFDPTRFQQVQIYNQPDPNKPGYNPNEEHALMAPSLRYASVSPRPAAAYALRDNDLNVTNRDSTYTSDPYVLVQFYDSLDQQYKMKVYNVALTATNFNAGNLSYSYGFNEQMNAGEPVIPFYPLPVVIGATPCDGTYGKDGQPTVQRCYWRDHKGTAWAVSGDSFFTMYFYYPLSPDFWWPPNDPKLPGDCVAWLPNTAAYSSNFFNIDYRRNDQTPQAQGVIYTTVWPQNVPVLKVGETLTFPGGEYHADNPTTVVTEPDGTIQVQDTAGLPGVVGWASGEVVFDTLNPLLRTDLTVDHYTVRLYQALEQRAVSLPVNDFPQQLLPATQRTTVQDGNYVFNELSASLKKRIFYDPINGLLVMKGFLNDKDIADPTLTAPPPAVYVLEPNIMTARERDELSNLESDDPNWTAAVQQLYVLSRNPAGIDLNGGAQPDDAYDIGLTPETARDKNFQQVTSAQIALLGTIQSAISALGLPTDSIGQVRDNLLVLLNKPAQISALGPGLAVTANPDFLDPTKATPPVSYVTLAENNDDSLGSSPVVLHIIKVDKSQRYRGAIQVILSDNVFDENIVLRHTGDFGGNADDLVFEWWYRPDDGTTALPPDRQASPTPWKLFADTSGNQGRGFYQLKLKGNPSAPEALLADTLFFVRYRHKNEVTDGVNWEVPQPNGEQRCVLGKCKPGIPYDWAGAGNSTPQDLDEDGQPDYQPQLAEGWIKRVLDRINPYEARINDFSGDNPATYSSIIEELGPRYEGPVALNPDKNVIENVGLIDLYETILKRGEDLSIDLSTPISTPAIANALELASTRLSEFYLLLGNEAYSDSLDPTIGFGSDSTQYGNLAPSIFAFENQVPSLLDQELALLRGQDDNKGAPVYNRLFWNFTKGEGEAAYAMKYNISDVNKDGFIDENDAMILYPQGHGDAWGDYLTALKMQYDLLRNPNFNWVSRSEYYNLQNIVIPVDYLDERTFAQIAAAKAQAGADIVNLTYRENYVADPRGQWQGYTDTDPNRAWGVDGWAHRAGQGAFFDWVTANALLPALDPNTNHTGIQKVDRTTVQDIAQVAAGLNAIQTTMDQVDKGNNPLGLANGALVFDIDPTFLEVGSTAQIGTSAVQGLLHFDQIYQRAVQALDNAKAAFDNANQLNNMIRQVANSTQDYNKEVFSQDVSYRNQLIEIFGTPYEGTIGTGKAYPAGYQGPDTMLYMYVPVNTLNDNTAPQPPAAYVQSYQAALNGDGIQSLINGTGLLAGVANSWLSSYGFSFQDAGTITNSVNYSDFTDTNVNSFVDTNMQASLNLPIMAKGYTYVAPADWGQRSSPGELQTLITQMLQAQADLNTAIYNWSAASAQYIIDLQNFNAKYDWNASILGLTEGQIGFDTALNVASYGLKLASGLVGVTSEAAQIPEQTAKEAVPTDTPIVGFSDGLGDALAPIRASLEAIQESVKETFNGVKFGLDQAAGATDLAKELGDAIFALEAEKQNQNFDMLQDLQNLNFNASNESGARIAVFKQVQVLSQLSDEYQAKLAEGQRLIASRTAFNKRVAADTQRSRYQDMTFRISRNAALEQYRSTFNIAARYAYLAGTAYDYDLNLAYDDPASPADLLADIVKQQTIGLVGSDGQPEVGAGGLAEDLAKLEANYGVLKAQMGLNNPQIETTTFSLRTEDFRILPDAASDDAWHQALLNASIYTPDLWQVPEFREYCRPFSAETNGPQPGLVIPFTTVIAPNKNFFGWPLGGMDNSYDPSVYATKINSVGVWFSGYDVADLSQTPRVYLLPVGEDIMTVPNSPDLSVRMWDVLDQQIPIPYPATSANFEDPNWRPLTDSLNGTFGETRRFSSLRAFGFAQDTLTPDEQSSLVYNARLVGRSVWNTKWMLIIPGATLNADPSHGLDLFINSVRDIKLVINSYGFSGN